MKVKINNKTGFFTATQQPALFKATHFSSLKQYKIQL